jgi:hypothetical protein
MASDQPHSGREVGDVNATVYVDTDLYPRSGEGNILHSDRQQAIRNDGA